MQKTVRSYRHLQFHLHVHSETHENWIYFPSFSRIKDSKFAFIKLKKLKFTVDIDDTSKLDILIWL